MASPASARKHVARPRSVAHRFAAACAAGVGDVYAVGVRYDDDEPAVGDSLVVRLRPGKIEGIGPVPGIARALVVIAEAPHVLDTAGALHRVADHDRRLVRDGVVDVVPHGRGAALLLDDGAVVDASGAVLGRAPGGRRLASDGARLVIVTDHAVVDLRGDVLVDHGGDVVAVSGDRVAVADGARVVIGGEAPRHVTASATVHALALFGSRLFVGCRATGLSCVEGTGPLRSLRPSLRAHGLHVVPDGLVVVCDLFIATSSDGEDFLSRDLAGYVRLAEKQS